MDGWYPALKAERLSLRVLPALSISAPSAVCASCILPARPRILLRASSRFQSQLPFRHSSRIGHGVFPRAFRVGPPTECERRQQVYRAPSQIIVER